MRQFCNSVPGWGPSKYFYWDDVPGRRLRVEILTSDQAIQAAKAFARRGRDETCGH